MEKKPEENPRPGLGTDPKSQWPELSKAEIAAKPIERLIPGSELHGKVLAYLLERIDMSQRAMQNFYSRWRVNEMKYQAYIDLEDFEKLLKNMNDAGEPPTALKITVPYSFATINTIVTYLLHTFAGRKPIFQVGSLRPETAQSSRLMEQVLQYNADRVRLVKLIYQVLMDTQLYGVGIYRTAWKKEMKMRTVYKEEQQAVFGLPSQGPGKKVRVRENRLVYSGNDVDTIDPFMFLPDPRVPMQTVNRKGEFVFWKTYEGKHILKWMQGDGGLKWVDAIGEMTEASASGASDPNSNRALLSQGEAHPGRDHANLSKVKNFNECVQGSVVIIPNELGLGNGTPEDDKPKHFLFTVVNRKQICQAEPMTCDHGMHPVAVAEPYSMGYGFGHCGMSDYLNPMQDLMSWFINSHVDNVKASLNNMWLVDPSRIEMQDLKEPGAGKIIRLKRSAYGADVRTLLSQFPVQDVTTNHVKDFQLLMGMTDAMSSITDNLRGLQDNGGRKTATEVRTAGEAAASRLAAQTRIVSAQQMTDLAEQMTMNIQQYIDEEFYISVLGQSGMATSLAVSPEMLVGDFNYPIHDGTLPLDRVALLDVWKEIYAGILADPGLRPNFDVMSMFKFIAELGGARNIDQFIIHAQPTDQMAGGPPPNSIPMAQAAQAAGQTPGLTGTPPSNRLVQGP